VKGFLAVPALAWVFAVLWALRYVGLRSDWVWTAQAAVGVLVAAIAVAARWREKLGRWRAGRASRANLERRCV
jgi:hypothetical protein